MSLDWKSSLFTNSSHFPAAGRACTPVFESKRPYPMGRATRGPGHPDANALLEASPAAKWHPNIMRMLTEE